MELVMLLRKAKACLLKRKQFFSGLATGLVAAVVAAVLGRFAYIPVKTRLVWSSMLQTEDLDRVDRDRRMQSMARLAFFSSYPRKFLVEQAKHGDQDSVLRALELLDVFGTGEDMSELADLINHEDREIRLTYVSILAEGITETSLWLLPRAIEDRDDGVRLAALLGLVKYGIPLRDQHGRYLASSFAIQAAVRRHCCS